MYRVSARVDTGRRPTARNLSADRADSRSAPRGGRAQAGREASVPRVVCPKPIHPDFAARAAGDLKKSDPEHHLLRRGDRHRIHDAAFGHHGLGHLHGAIGGHRIAGEAAEHDLAVAAANADAAAAGARTNLFLEIAGVQGDLHVDHADQLHALIEYRDVGGPNLLALNVQPTIRHRQCVDELGRAHHRAGERLWEH